MLNLSAIATLEKNKIASDSAWLTLLEVQTPAETIRICQNTENISWSGQTWVAFPFTIDSVKQSKTELPSVPVKVSNVTRAIEAYIEEYSGLMGCTVKLMVVNTKASHRDGGVLVIDGPAEVDEEFVNRHTKSDADWATFTLGAALAVMKRFPFRRILKDWCPFPYKEIECAATSSLPDCSHTLQACRDRGNSVRFGGEPSMAQGGLYASNR